MAFDSAVYPGQTVVTSHGTRRVVAFARDGLVYVWGLNGVPEVARVADAEAERPEGALPRRGSHGGVSPHTRRSTPPRRSAA
jgi:hypothetical protein